jgi:hypothetical protein
MLLNNVKFWPSENLRVQVVLIEASCTLKDYSGIKVLGSVLSLVKNESCYVIYIGVLVDEW